MASFSVFLLRNIMLVLSVIGRSNPQSFAFDPSSTPGPLQECSDGIPRMGGTIPFTADTQLNDENIGYWVERHAECKWGNYFNNVEHIDYDTLSGNLIGPNWEQCYARSDGTQQCSSDPTQSRIRAEMIRNIVDVTEVTVEVIAVNGRSLTIATNGSLILQVPVGAFLVGHAFEDYMVDEYEFNDDGTIAKNIERTEDDLSSDLMEWAEKTLSGMGDYLKVDYANKHNYYQIDLGDTGVREYLLDLLYFG